jgi:hypothetical protein
MLFLWRVTVQYGVQYGGMGVDTNALSRDADMRRRDVDARGDGRSFCHAEMMPLSMAAQITQCYHCFRVAAVIPTMMPVVPVVRVKLDG